jgi:flavin reductase (DIM6/NTAB) family NADH-FMN oxidoreductase RutF
MTTEDEDPPTEGEQGQAAAIAAGMAAFTDRMDYPLFVLTVGVPDDEPSGCLAGFVTQCSIVPPRFLVCVSKVNHTFFATERSDGLALHLLGEGQTALASLFGEESGDSVSKFDYCAWSLGATGSPLLDDCAAWLECRVLDRFDVGDHRALLVRPLSGGPGNESGVLTYRNAPDFNAGHPATA